MKKYFALFLCLIIVFSFVACSKAEKNCYNCNKKISVDDVYCKYCGAENIDYDNEKPKATATIYISSSSINNDFSISSSGIEKHAKQAASCVSVLKNDSTLTELQRQLSFSTSTKELNNSIYFDNNSAPIINITVFSGTKEQAKEILTCLLNIAPDIINHEYPDLTVKVLNTVS